MDTAELLFEQIRQRGAAFIRELIELSEPEGLHLEFKRKSNPDGQRALSNEDLRNYRRALSGFANSAGGVLVWGVGETKGGAKRSYASAPIESPNTFVQTLNDVLPTAVSRAIVGVRNSAFPLDDGDSGFVVTFVPESSLAPHRAESSGDKHYYKRVGSSFLVMEHYEIEDMFGRRQKPRLEIDLGYEQDQVGHAYHNYILNAHVHNSGRAMARYFKVELDFPAMVFGWSEDSLDFRPSAKVVQRACWGDPQMPLFPGDTRILDNMNGLQYHMNFPNADYFDEHGWPDLSIRIFLEGRPREERRVQFRTLQIFS